MSLSLLQSTRKLPVIFRRLLVALCTLGILSSCSQKQQPVPPSTQVAYNGEDWNLVQKSPPTYFPKGVPSSYQTNFEDGHWILTGDKDKSQYFIPIKAPRSNQLIAQAQSRVVPEVGKKTNNNHPNDLRTQNPKKFTFADCWKIPFILAGFFAAAIAGVASPTGLPGGTWGDILN
ncbi:hypothetical protein N8491_03110 [Akkermansiaceae bacterium]|nr:hypothetical protein [Akkermansiaceae bacterium]MDB4389123.1 hypothetical protein [Akkermansiaceae bacterium]MDB4697327.1 hypothetical protein [Akkermansiaceae bacterium]